MKLSLLYIKKLLLLLCSYVEHVSPDDVRNKKCYAIQIEIVFNLNIKDSTFPENKNLLPSIERCKEVLEKNLE